MKNHYPLNQILYGAPGTGKTYITAEYAIDIIEDLPDQHAKIDRKIVMDKYRDYTQEGQIVFTTFHQSYGYEEFIQGIRPNVNNGTLTFGLKDGIFKRLAEKAQNNPNRNYVMIIDEINRGNISKIFGELITLIEKDKRKGEENELSAVLPSGEVFFVPNNLYIIGTMNTADKSISLLDAALRRRFIFKEVFPDSSLIKNIRFRQIMDSLNNYLSQNLGNTDLLIGHAYFMDKKDKDLIEIMNDNIIPLLYEYLFNDREKVKEALNDADLGDIEICDIEKRRIFVREKGK